MDYLKYGIVGCGGAWNFHSAGIGSNPKIKIESIFDVDEKKRRRNAKKSKAQAYSSYDELLKSDIDAVLIMVPHYLHEEYVLAAAEAGKHVLCEKPMATTIEGCDQMIEATKKAGQDAVAVTDHGSMSYLWETYKAARKAGIKLIAGCEVYFVDNADDDEDTTLRHLVLLAKNQKGYQNLLTSVGSIRKPLPSSVAFQEWIGIYLKNSMKESSVPLHVVMVLLVNTSCTISWMMQRKLH